VRRGCRPNHPGRVGIEWQFVGAGWRIENWQLKICNRKSLYAGWGCPRRISDVNLRNNGPM
jgi:hypothetical protein